MLIEVEKYIPISNIPFLQSTTCWFLCLYAEAIPPFYLCVYVENFTLLYCILLYFIIQLLTVVSILQLTTKY